MNFFLVFLLRVSCMMMMSSLQTVTIQGIHILVIAFFILTPYVPWRVEPKVRDLPLWRDSQKEWCLSNLSLIDVLYVVSCFGLLSHWAMNSDVCILTQIESWLRGINSSDSFLQRIIRPIYLVTDSALKKATYAVIIVNLTYIFFFKERY